MSSDVRTVWSYNSDSINECIQLIKSCANGFKSFKWIGTCSVLGLPQITQLIYIHFHSISIIIFLAIWLIENETCWKYIQHRKSLRKREKIIWLHKGFYPSCSGACFIHNHSKVWRKFTFSYYFFFLLLLLFHHRLCCQTISLSKKFEIQFHLSHSPINLFYLIPLHFHFHFSWQN